MTRQITHEAVRAFYNMDKFSKSNTQVKDNALYLFNNKIAWHDNGRIYISMCGWNSCTTRERLNGLRGVSICSRNYTPYDFKTMREIDPCAVYEVTSEGLQEVKDKKSLYFV